MTKLEQLEQQKAALAEKQKAVSKALAVERRKAKAKAEADARAKELDEALDFLAYCRNTVIRVGDNQMTIYDYADGMRQRHAGSQSE